MKKSGIAAAVLVAACCLRATGAEDEGVTVVGSGEASGRPNAFEFFTRIGGAAELGADALTKFCEFKRRTAAAVEKLELSDGDVAVGGFSLTSANDGQTQFCRGDDGEDVFKPEIVFSSLVRVRVRGIGRLPDEQVPKTISELFDRLKDAGVAIVPVQANANLSLNEFDIQDGFDAAPVMVFVLEDATELRRLARQRAFQAARHSAEEFARLAGAELGPAVSIQEVNGRAYPWMGMFVPEEFEAPQGETPGKLRMISATMSEIPVRARLRVRFQLKPQSLGSPQGSLSAAEGVGAKGSLSAKEGGP
ncbi:MAG TPA: SIMPL domain-containing protein [Pirellulales bacterium]|jgi:hypothetical protein|nr:SIMPL domain-containing protein [Pirellulales bacterium]